MPNGVTVEVWLKASHLHPGISDAAPLREWMAAKLAEALDVPCSPPVLVRISDEFIDSLHDQELVNALVAGPSVTFGSMHLGNGWRRWTEAARLLRATHQAAARTYLFDTVIQNWDRRHDNPNLLKKGTEFRVIDHEETFASASGDAEERPYAKLPWKVGGLDNYVAGGYQHPFWQILKPSKHVNFEEAAGAWKSLPPDTFSLYASQAPADWGPDTGKDIAAYLDDAVDHIDEVVAAIEGAREL